MKPVHHWLCRKNAAYRKWHKFKYHKHIHWAALVLAIFSAGLGSWIVLRPSTNLQAATAINSQLPFQGRLTNSDGTVVADASYDVVFTIYDDPTAGNTLWTENHTSSNHITTSKGIFNTMLGSITAFGALNYNSDLLYLGIKVGSDAEMTPRIRLGAAPYAMNSNQLNGLSSTSFAILAGQAGGQTINGGTAASENLTLFSTANATKGKILFGTSGYDEANNRLGIGTSSPNAQIDIGGYGTPSITSAAGFLFGAKSAVDGISGMEFKNTNAAGTSADSRFSVFDTTGNYTSFALPGVGNTVAALFGLNRATTTYIFNANSGTARDMAIGTLGAKDLILGTNNQANLTIKSGGNVGIGISPSVALDVKGNLRLNGSSSGYVGFAPAAAAGSTTYTLPSADGSANAALITSGAGVLSWSQAIGTSSTPQFGRIGLGAAASSTNSLYAYKASADSSWIGVNSSIKSTITTNATLYQSSGQFDLMPTVNSGVTNSGSARGIYVGNLRNEYSGVDDSGTLSGLYGMLVSAGHYNTTKYSNPTTTTSAGIYVNPYIEQGTITTYYGLYLAAKSTMATPTTWATGVAKALNAQVKPTVANGYYYTCTTAGTTGGSEPTWNTTPGGTTTDNDIVWTTIVIPAITNEWGVYSASTTAKNYFAGNVGIGATPTNALTVAGTIDGSGNSAFVDSSSNLIINGGMDSWASASSLRDWNSAQTSNWNTGSALNQESSNIYKAPYSAKLGRGIAGNGNGMAQTNSFAVTPSSSHMFAAKLAGGDSSTQAIIILKAIQSDNATEITTGTPLGSGWTYSASYGGWYYSLTPGTSYITTSRLISLASNVYYLRLSIQYYTGGTNYYIYADNVQITQGTLAPTFALKPLYDSGNQILEDNLTVNGTMLGASSLTLGAASGTTGSLLFKGTTSGTITVTPAAAAGTWSLTLPTSGGTSNYVLATTDGAGTSSWVSGQSIAGLTTTSTPQFANVGIGGAASVAVGAYIRGTFTGANQYGAYVLSPWGSDATSAGISYYSAPSTTAASFTMGGMFHFRAADTSLGAGSAITSQYGFYSNDLTTATNNYGFYSAVTSGANKYSIYTSTAASYFGGTMAGASSLTLGTASGTTGSLLFKGATSGTVTVTPAAAAGTWSLTLPTSGGTSNYVLATTDGAGTSSWVSGQSIAGLTTGSSVQFANVGIGQASSVALDVKGNFRLNGSSSGYVGFAPAAAAGSTTYTLPAADGSANAALITSGAGVLSWSQAIGTASTPQFGKIGIGGAAATSVGVYAYGTPTTGVSQYGVDSNLTFGSDATTAGYSYISAPITTAASYTMSNLYGYYASDATKGSGSTITTQYGLYIANQTTGATNYSIYTGTAQSYFGGILQVNKSATNANIATTPGTTVGGIHISPSTTSNGDIESITFGGVNATANTAQAGIYVQSSDSYGAGMVFGTTDAYASGVKTRMIIDTVGRIGMGIAAQSSWGLAVSYSASAANGIYGVSNAGVGVEGVSTGSYGIEALSTNGHGLYASGGQDGIVAEGGASGDGINAGAGASGRGVYGAGGYAGVYGYETDTGAYGLLGYSGYGIYISGSHNFDLAEVYQAEPGANLGKADVLVVSSTQDTKLGKSSKPYDPDMAGVYSTRPAMLIGATSEKTGEVGIGMGQVADSNLANGEVPLALAGRVPVNVVNEGGEIHRGDFLTSSSTAGYAMKMTHAGPMLGTAMEDMTGNSGTITILISLGWGDPTNDFGKMMTDVAAQAAQITNLDSQVAQLQAEMNNQSVSFAVNHASNPAVFVAANGNVGIGVENTTSFKLAVAGDIGPINDNQYSLGSSAKRFTAGYFGAAGITVSGDSNSTLVFAIIDGMGKISTDANTPIQLTSGTNAGVNVETNGKVGVGTTTPSSSLEVNGSIATAITKDAKTDDYTLADTDGTIKVDATSKDIVIALPSAVGAAGRNYTIKRIDNTVHRVTILPAVTVLPNPVQTIDDSANYLLKAKNQCVSIQSDNANWLIIGGN